MFYILVALLISGLIYGPHLWVRIVLSRYSRELPDLPGTGGELAQHLLNRFQFDTVKVEQSEPDNNHYSPSDNAVRLSPEVYNGKSLTAIAVAAHEVGHAIQFNREEPVSQLRKHYLGSAQKIQRVGAFVLMLAPLILAIIHIPHLTLITLVIGVITMLASVAMYAAILPEEWDASFNKALPILVKGEYIDEHQTKAVKQVLKACALTYVAGALADIFRLWRWVAILRRY